MEIFNKGPKKVWLNVSVHHIPVLLTFMFLDQGRIFAIDPSLEEEEIMEGRISIAMNIYGDICSIHKPGGACLSPEIFQQLFLLCAVKAVEMTKLIRNVLKL